MNNETPNTTKKMIKPGYRTATGWVKPIFETVEVATTTKAKAFTKEDEARLIAIERGMNIIHVNF